MNLSNDDTKMCVAQIIHTNQISTLSPQANTPWPSPLVCTLQFDQPSSAKRQCEGRDKENVYATPGGPGHESCSGQNSAGGGANMADLLGGHLACPICVSVRASRAVLAAIDACISFLKGKQTCWVVLAVSFCPYHEVPDFFH